MNVGDVLLQLLRREVEHEAVVHVVEQAVAFGETRPVERLQLLADMSEGDVGEAEGDRLLMLVSGGVVGLPAVPAEDLVEPADVAEGRLQELLLVRPPRLRLLVLEYAREQLPADFEDDFGGALAGLHLRSLARGAALRRRRTRAGHPAASAAGHALGRRE